MKKLILILFPILLASCSTVKNSTSTAKVLDIYGPGVVQKAVVVELDVKETKTTGSVTGSTNTPIERTKHEAVVQAIKKVNADVLIEPKFESETVKGKTTVTASGFPGYYKNFRPMVAEDTLLLKVGLLQKAETYEPPIIKKKSNGAGIAVLVILAGAAIAVLAGKK